jgi:hypothetical protein
MLTKNLNNTQKNLKQKKQTHFLKCLKLLINLKNKIKKSKSQKFSKTILQKPFELNYIHIQVQNSNISNLTSV